VDLGLKGMVAVVTGGSSGIGAAVARKFGAEGAKVALTYRGDASGADRVVREIERLGGEAMSIRYDLNDDHSMEQAVQAVAGKWGSIHVLVNNDVRWPEPRQLAFEDVPPESWRQEIRANQEGYYFTIQQALPYIRKSGWGRIVNISSGLAEDGMPGRASYTAAKAGIHGLTATLAKELGPEGIYVNVVMPGFTLTEKAMEKFPKEMLERERIKVPTRKHSVPDDIANLVVFLGSRANGNINGEVIRVSGGE